MDSLTKTINCQLADQGERFVHSLHDTGFAVLKNHPIPVSLLNQIHKGWLEFFLSPEKHQYLFDANSDVGTQEGYVPPRVSETAVAAAHKDLKEFFHVVPGGQLPEYLAQDIFEYRRRALDLGHTMLDWVQQHTPEEITKRFLSPLPPSLSKEASLLRVLHYPPLTGSEKAGAVRAAAHEDINLLTVLPVALQPGLQIMSKTGAWLELPVKPGELIINTGDMLKELTEGYFPSTTHRVVNPEDLKENVSRISVPFFLAPQKDYALSSRYTAGTYLNERLEQLSRL